MQRDISQQDFSSVLSRSRNDVEKTVEEQARAGAEQFVAIAMIQPLLKQWRESNAAAPPFAPSQGEKQFQSLFDGQIAQQIARASRFPLVERVAEQLLLRTKKPGPAAPTDGESRKQTTPQPSLEAMI